MADYTPPFSAGLSVAYGSASNAATNTLTNIVRASVPSDEYPAIDISCLTSSRRVYKAASLADGGEFEFTIQGKASVLSTLDGLKGTEKWWSIGLPDTTGDILFSGIITQAWAATWDDPDGVYELDVSVKVNSAQTITVGS